MKRIMITGLLPLVFLVAGACRAGAASGCQNSFCYYRVQEGLVYQGQTLIQFGTAQQVARLAHPVVLTVRVGPRIYRLVYKIADNVITRSGQKAVAVDLGIAQLAGHRWKIIGKPRMELLDGRMGSMSLKRLDANGRTIAWRIVFQARPLARYQVLQLLQKAQKPAGPKPYHGLPIHESMSTLLTSATPGTCCRTPCNPGPGILTCCGAVVCCDCDVCCQPP